MYTIAGRDKDMEDSVAELSGVVRNMKDRGVGAGAEGHSSRERK